MNSVPSPIPTRSQVLTWDTTALDDATQRWCAAAGTAETAFEQHRQNIAAPGGSIWEGGANDAALDRVTNDLVVARRQGDVQRATADVAARGSEDIRSARRAVLDAIAEAEADGFRVDDDLSVVDGREFDPGTAAARAVAAAEHAEYIRWRAEQLIATDALVGHRLQLKAVELQGIRFDGEAVSRDDSIQLVDHRTGGGRRTDTDSAAGAAPSSLQELLGGGKTAPEQPEDLDDALSDIAGEPVTAPPTAVDQILNQHTGTGKSDRSHTRSPLEAPIVDADPSVIDQQIGRAEAARRNLDAAQAALDDAAGQSYAQGAGGGPGQSETLPLSQAVFDARRELTEQTRILDGLNYAASETGRAPVDVPAVPPDTDVQAFPPEPSAFAEGSRALSEGSFGLIPDVAHVVDVFTNWDQHSAADRAGAILDVAGMVPIPGGKFVTEGLEHGLDALSGAARHADDLPTPDVDIPHHSATDIGHAAAYGLEETRALLTTSEAAGGHLLERHVGQSFNNLADRLEANPKFGEVSTFRSVDEAARAVSAALQHNQSALDSWVSDGARKTLIVTAPFNGGEVLTRGSVESVAGTAVKVVLKGDGMGNWNVLTGYVLP